VSRGAFAIRDALIRAREGIAVDLAVEGEVIVEDLHLSLSVPYPPPSAPGAFPHLRTGDLRASYDSQVDGTTLEIGSTQKYAVYLEFGTRKMAPRPHLRPIVARHMDGLRARVGDGIERREARR
jgi:hypothetical protein